MTTIDRNFLKDLRTDIDAALAAVAKKHKVLINAGSCRFTESEATFKLVVSATGAGDAAKPGASAADAVDADNYRKYAKLEGMKVAWLNKTYTLKGSTWRLVGFKPSRRKYGCVVAPASGVGAKKLTTVDAIICHFA